MARSEGLSLEVDNLNVFLRALRQLPKDLEKELKKESQDIAGKLVVPAYRAEAAKVPMWGHVLSSPDAIRAKLDRIPSVGIGYASASVSRKVGRNGAADSRTLRHPTETGLARGSFAPFTPKNWMQRAASQINAKAVEMWVGAIDRVVDKWNRG